MKGIEKIKRGRVDKNMSRTIILIAFGISGMVALIYEVVWTRPLSLIFGSTIYGAILPNRISMASEGEITLSGKHSFNPLSPERILQSNLRDKATYATSFKCGDFPFASSVLSSNVSRGISSSSFLMKEKNFYELFFRKFCKLEYFIYPLTNLKKQKLWGYEFKFHEKFV